MATTPLYNAPRPDRVRMNDRLWDSEVRLAEAAEGPPAPDIAYEFNGGRKFKRPPAYAPIPEDQQ